MIILCSKVDLTKIKGPCYRDKYTCYQCDDSYNRYVWFKTNWIVMKEEDCNERLFLDFPDKKLSKSAKQVMIIIRYILDNMYSNAKHKKKCRPWNFFNTPHTEFSNDAFNKMMKHLKNTRFIDGKINIRFTFRVVNGGSAFCCVSYGQVFVPTNQPLGSALGGTNNYPIYGKMLRLEIEEFHIKEYASKRTDQDWVNVIAKGDEVIKIYL